MMSKRQCGLTLIEVMIALAIISIALTAVIKATTQSIKGTTYLQDKTLALLVAQEVLHGVQANIIKLPENGEQVQRKSIRAGQAINWLAELSATPNRRIKKVTVKILKDPNNVDETMLTLETYVYHEDQST